MSETGRVNAVLRACALVDSIAASDGRLTLAAAAAATGLTKPTAHRLLSTLEAAGWVSRTSRGEYCLAPQMFVIGQAVPTTNVVQLADPVVRTLASDLGDATYLFTLRDDTELVCLRRYEGTHPIRVHLIDEGDRLPLARAASATRVVRELEEVREQGYVISRDELTTGVTGVSAPILDAAGELGGVMTVLATSDRLSGDHLETAIATLTAAAGQVSAGLGHRQAVG